MFDQNEFITNSSAFTDEQLKPYRGRHVAWSFDGRQILAAGDTPEELAAAIRAAGVVETCVRDYIDPEWATGAIGWVELDVGGEHDLPKAG